MDDINRTDVLKSILAGALSRVQARALAARALAGSRLPGPVTLLALGKVAGELALGARDALGARLGEVVVAGPRGGVSVPGARVFAGGHPLPDAGSVAAGEALLEAAAAARGAGGSVIGLVSGGGSALAEAPADEMTLGVLIAHYRSLLESGEPIERLNEARRKLSRLKGGGLARAVGDVPGTVLVMSDVPSGDPAVVSSGPFWDGRWRARHRVIGDLTTLADAACETAGSLGVNFEEAEVPLTGDVEAVAQQLAAWAREHATGSAPILYAAAGEATINLRSSSASEGTSEPGGRRPAELRSAAGGGEVPHLESNHGVGGRAQHLALRFAELCAGLPVALLAAGSDGRDGPTDHAGAVVNGETALGAAASDIRDALARFDSAPCCARLGVALPRAATGTHLGDLYCVLAGG